MKSLRKKEFNEAQPAIDTPCDNCGAIYDRVDCATSSSGITFCPDCRSEDLKHNNLLSDSNLALVRKFVYI